MVAELREKTGAGLLDCKKALDEAQGNQEEAQTILRKKLGGKIDKLSSRATKDGLVESYIHVGGKVGVLLEVNCETDFVAKTDDFKAFCRDLCLQTLHETTLAAWFARHANKADLGGGPVSRPAAVGREADPPEKP
jgi:translation elongation factor EF-Ts